MSTAPLKTYQRASAPDMEQLVQQYAPLVKRIAHHLAARLPASVQIDDLIQAGMMGLMEAIHRFDPTQGASFETFAEWRIRGTMLDEMRRGDWVPRSVHRKGREVSAAIAAVEAVTGREAKDREVAEQLGVSIDEYYQLLMDLRGQKLLSLEASEEDETAQLDRLESPLAGPMATVAREKLLDQLAEAIESLPEREGLVLGLYYDEGLNLKEIGAVLRVSESRVSQLHSQALARLRARTRELWDENSV